MKYEPHRLRPALEALRRPFDSKFNKALAEILLILEPFEELEVYVAKLAGWIKELEETIQEIQKWQELRDAKEEAEADNLP